MTDKKVIALLVGLLVLSVVLSLIPGEDFAITAIALFAIYTASSVFLVIRKHRQFNRRK